jgi:hypothetical protein
MKKFLIVNLLLVFIWGACQKQPEWQENAGNQIPVPDRSVFPDQTHNDLARVLALALADKQVRLFLHDEISRQFTGDFDILYDLIKDREVISDTYGTVSFADLLLKTAAKAGIDFSSFTRNAREYKNLQISSPVYFPDWNPEHFLPLVISLPVDYREGRGERVAAFDATGSVTWLTENDIREPFLLVRQAERVDAGGMMRVDPDGFVIPEAERTVTAPEAYAWSSLSLKSANPAGQQNVIEVLGNDAFQQALNSRRSSVGNPPSEIPPKQDPAPVERLKSVTSPSMVAPANFSVNPAGPGTIQISWSQVAGAVAYEIYRQYDVYPNYLLTTVGADQINYYDQYLLTGDHYTYSVRAVDESGGTSVLTDGKESYASWRTNGNRDVIDKIYLDSDCWNWCCGLFDGKIELQYKTSYVWVPNNTTIAYPGTGVNNLGQKSRDQQKGKWCTYNHYLFPWDVRSCSYSYRFKLIEDDGDGNGVTVKLGNTFKIQLLKIVDLSFPINIEFKIAEKDEEFGEVIIQYWEWKNGPYYYSDGYDVIPDKGHARMYLKQ